MPARPPSEAERAHFRRIAANDADDQACAPRSLEELFERLDTLRQALGRWAEPGIEGEDESELAAHLRVHQRLRDRELARTRHG